MRASLRVKEGMMPCGRAVENAENPGKYTRKRVISGPSAQKCVSATRGYGGPADLRRHGSAMRALVAGGLATTLPFVDNGFE